MTKSLTRKEMREHIFKLLFQIEFVPVEGIDEQVTLYIGDLANIRSKDRQYIHDKCLAIAARIEELDTLLNERTTGWRTNRMNKVDLTILRLAVYEIKYDDDIPQGVAINEAVELAKVYSSDEGPAFVNGVLARIVTSAKSGSTASKSTESKSEGTEPELADMTVAANNEEVGE